MFLGIPFDAWVQALVITLVPTTIAITTVRYFGQRRAKKFMRQYCRLTREDIEIPRKWFKTLKDSGYIEHNWEDLPSSLLYAHLCTKKEVPVVIYYRIHMDVFSLYFMHIHDSRIEYRLTDYAQILRADNYGKTWFIKKVY
jgi:hypothetical protein